MGQFGSILSLQYNRGLLRKRSFLHMEKMPSSETTVSSTYRKSESIKNSFIHKKTPFLKRLWDWLK